MTMALILSQILGVDAQDIPLDDSLSPAAKANKHPVSIIK
jgi:hypothetical protein